MPSMKAEDSRASKNADAIVNQTVISRPLFYNVAFYIICGGSLSEDEYQAVWK